MNILDAVGRFTAAIGAEFIENLHRRWLRPKMMPGLLLLLAWKICAGQHFIIPAMLYIMGFYVVITLISLWMGDSFDNLK